MGLTTLQGTSCVSPDYMAQQFDINERMRAILIDWLVEVQVNMASLIVMEFLLSVEIELLKLSRN